MSAIVHESSLTAEIISRRKRLLCLWILNGFRFCTARFRVLKAQEGFYPGRSLFEEIFKSMSASHNNYLRILLVVEVGAFHVSHLIIYDSKPVVECQLFFLVFCVPGVL